MDIVSIRASLGLTQAQFAEALEVSPGHIGDLERGHRKLSLKVAARLERLAKLDGLVDEVLARKMDAA